MTPPPDPRLDGLLVRYWDDALTAAEADELESRLAADPLARGRFEEFARQVVTAAELSPVPVPKPQPTAGFVRPAGSRRWSRRRVLGYLGGGLAAGVGAVVLGRRFWPEPEPEAPTPRVTAATGSVMVRAAGGRVVSGDRVPPGGSVTTAGTGSSAVLAYPDGTTLTLIGDASVAVARTGRRLMLGQGVATADVRPHPAGGAPLTLSTAQVTLPAVAGVLVTLGRAALATDVEVHRGLVTASTAAGERLDVRSGEVLTVRADGGHLKQPISVPPDKFVLDLDRPLPEGWRVGQREETADGPVVVPEFWPDPYYHGTHMYQIRSHEPWLRGLFRLAPESRVRVRYRVDQPGQGQLCFCARTPDSRCPDTGMFEWNGLFTPPDPDGDGWRWLDVTAAAMRLPPNKESPKFGPPWVAFLMIFNTYAADLGLRVAEFRVDPPGRAG